MSHLTGRLPAGSPLAVAAAVRMRVQACQCLFTEHEPVIHAHGFTNNVQVAQTPEKTVRQLMHPSPTKSTRSSIELRCIHMAICMLACSLGTGLAAVHAFSCRFGVCRDV